MSKLEPLHLDLPSSSYEFSKTALNSAKNRNRERQRLTGGPTLQRYRDPGELVAGETRRGRGLGGIQGHG